MLLGLLEGVVAGGADVTEIAAVGAVQQAGGVTGEGPAVELAEVVAGAADFAKMAASRAVLGVGRVMRGNGIGVGA